MPAVVVQGYLAHKKLLPSLGPPQDPGCSPKVRPTLRSSVVLMSEVPLPRWIARSSILEQNLAFP
jgi:hypothetical protein